MVEKKVIKLSGKNFKDVIKEKKVNLIKALKKKTFNLINEKYPNYKQININNLQNYTEEDKEKMWKFINRKREACNKTEEKIKRAKVIEILEKIEEKI